MASKSLGTLTIDLIAKVGGFVSGMDRAERATEEWRKKVQQDAAEAAKALLSAGAAATALATSIGVAGYNLLKSTSKQIADTDRWAKSLHISTQELLAWQFAAEKAGVSGDNIADIFKDISDKIGDASLNKSGEAVDALDALGLSAEKLSRISPDRQLMVIGEALQKIKEQPQKVTILESLGNDLSKLLPLFDNNNEKLKQLIQLSKDYGIALDSSQIDDLLKVNSIFEDIEAQVKGLKIEIASGLARADLSPLHDSLDQVRDLLTEPKVLEGLTELVSGVAELAGWIIKAAAAIGTFTSLINNRVAAIGGNVDIKKLDQINERIIFLQNNMEKFKDGGSIFDALTPEGDTSLAAAKKNLEELVKIRNELSMPKAGNLPVQVATVITGSEYSNNGVSNGKPKANSSANKLDNSFKQAEQSYLRQIALLDTTGKKNQQLTEIEKVHYDLTEGKLKGLNAAQKARLEQLAAEFDQMKATKKLNEENITLAEFVANLQRQNDNDAASLNAEVSGAGLGDKERQRLQERLSIEKSFIEQRRDLEKQLNADDISQSLYDKQTTALDDALKQRLTMQEDYYQQLDVLQGNWLAGAQNGFANWADNASDYYSQISSLTESTMTGLVDNISDALSGNKVDWGDWASSVLQSLQRVLLNAVLVDNLKSLSGSGGILGSFGGLFGAAGGAAGVKANAKGGVYESHDLSKFSGQIVKSPTMFAFAKGAGLMGEAGPEAIMPLTRTSDGTLGVRMVSGESLGGGGTTGGAIHITQHITVTGNGDAALAHAMQQAARQGAADGAKQARNDMLNDFQTRGQARRMLGV